MGQRLFTPKPIDHIQAVALAKLTSNSSSYFSADHVAVRPGSILAHCLAIVSNPAAFPISYAAAMALIGDGTSGE